MFKEDKFDDDQIVLVPWLNLIFLVEKWMEAIGKLFTYFNVERLHIRNFKVHSHHTVINITEGVSSVVL